MMPITHSSLAGDGWWFKWLKIASSPWPNPDDPGLSSEHQFSQLTCTVNICEHSLSYFQHSEIHHQAVLSSSGKKSKPAACLVGSQVTTWHWGLGPGTSMHSRDYCGCGCRGWDGAFKAGTLIGNWFEDGQRRGHHSGGSHLAICRKPTAGAGPSWFLWWGANGATALTSQLKMADAGQMRGTCMINRINASHQICRSMFEISKHACVTWRKPTMLCTSQHESTKSWIRMTRRNQESKDWSYMCTPRASINHCFFFFDIVFEYW